MLDLSIIVINWNSAAFVRKCLQSIYSETKGLDFEVIVVDNASFDDCGQIVRRTFPAARFIQSPCNLGFAKANNLGVHDARGRNLLFLNPDTEVLGDALPRMVSFLDGTSDAAVVGCRLLNTDRSLQTSCVQSFPSILNQAFDAEPLRRIFPKLRMWGMQALLRPEDAPAAVDVISGACLMIKSEVFEAVGRFSPNYFMYAEDSDLCYKVKEAGLKSYYLGNSSVLHHGGRSSDTKPEDNFSSIMMRESLLMFMRLRRGRIYALVYQSSTVVVAILRLLLLMVFLISTLGRYRRETLRLALVKWVRVLRWALRMETWSRQPA